MGHLDAIGTHSRGLITINSTKHFHCMSVLTSYSYFIQFFNRVHHLLLAFSSVSNSLSMFGISKVMQRSNSQVPK